MAGWSASAGPGRPRATRAAGGPATPRPLLLLGLATAGAALLPGAAGQQCGESCSGLETAYLVLIVFVSVVFGIVPIILCVYCYRRWLKRRAESRAADIERGHASGKRKQKRGGAEATEEDEAEEEARKWAEIEKQLAAQFAADAALANEAATDEAAAAGGKGEPPAGKGGVSKGGKSGGPAKVAVAPAPGAAEGGPGGLKSQASGKGTAAVPGVADAGVSKAGVSKGGKDGKASARENLRKARAAAMLEATHAAEAASKDTAAAAKKGLGGASGKVAPAGAISSKARVELPPLDRHHAATAATGAKGKKK